MGILRNAIDCAIAEAIAEHPKYFTPKGLEHARGLFVRKVMASLRDGADAPSDSSVVPELPQGILAEIGSPEAMGYQNVRYLAGAVAPQSMGGKIFVPPKGNVPSVVALGLLPPKDEWKIITDHRRLAAWLYFFAEVLPKAARRPVIVERDGVRGALLPYPYPPNKEGKIYLWEEADVA